MAFGGTDLAREIRLVEGDGQCGFDTSPVRQCVCRWSTRVGSVVVRLSEKRGITTGPPGKSLCLFQF